MILRIKGVKTVKTKGRVYHYHRKTMTALPGEPGTTEFMDKLKALDKRKVAETKNTVGALIAAYKASPEYTELAPGSKREYGKALGHLQPLDKVPLAEVDAPTIYRIRDRLLTKYSRSAANRTVLFLRRLFDWGRKRHFCKINPAADVDLVRRPKDAPVVNRRWRDEEFEKVLAAAPQWLKVPIAIAAFTGMRESDVASVTWAAYDGKEFETRQLKTGNPIWIAAHYRLREILDTAPRAHDQIVVGQRGLPLAPDSLGSRFFKFMVGLRESGEIGGGLSFHGLRHTLGTRLAEAGCSPATIAAVLGQLSTKMAEHYSRTADRHYLANAAIGTIEQQDVRKSNRKTAA